MFKVEVNVNGDTKGHYNMNKHDDDFVQFLPEIYTRMYGEEITKEDLTIYKIEESKFHLYEGRKSQHANNIEDCSVEGKLRICRHDSSLLESGWNHKSVAEEFKASRDSIFSDSATPTNVNLPTEGVHNFGDGDVPAYNIPENHETTLTHSTLELELTGVELEQWPYDDDGKFLGNN